MASNEPARHPRVPPALQRANRVVRTFAGRRFYALLRHQGRKTGKRFETPVMAWRTTSGMLVPLSWGTTADWYRNLVVAQGCDVQKNGRWYHCTNPALIQRDEALALLPSFTRTFARLFPIKQFVLLRQVEPGGFVALVGTEKETGRDEAREVGV